MATQKVTTPEILTSSVRAGQWGHAWNPNTLKVEAEESKQVGANLTSIVNSKSSRIPRWNPYSKQTNQPTNKHENLALKHERYLVART